MSAKRWTPTGRGQDLESESPVGELEAQQCSRYIGKATHFLEFSGLPNVK